MCVLCLQAMTSLLRHEYPPPSFPVATGSQQAAAMAAAAAYRYNMLMSASGVTGGSGINADNNMSPISPTSPYYGMGFDLFHYSNNDCSRVL